VAISAITLLEIVMLSGAGLVRIQLSLDEVFEQLDTNPSIQIVPLSIEVAKESSFLGPILCNPADRIIVATARVHGLL